MNIDGPQLFSVVRQIGFTIGIMMILYSAILYMTSVGASERIGRAHRIFFKALILIAVLLVAGDVVPIVCKTFGMLCS